MCRQHKKDLRLLALDSAPETNFLLSTPDLNSPNPAVSARIRRPSTPVNGVPGPDRANLSASLESLELVSGRMLY